MLCTTAQIKDYLGIGADVTEFDALLETLAVQVSDQLARHVGRVTPDGASCLERVTVVEPLSVERGTRHVWTCAAPVILVSSITEAFDGDHAGAAAVTLAADVDYILDAAAGRLFRVGGFWLAGERSVRLGYVGGFTQADPWQSGSEYALGDLVSHEQKIYAAAADIEESLLAPPNDLYDAELESGNWIEQAGERPLPPAIVMAAVQQSAYVFERRKKLGLASEGRGSGSLGWGAQDELLPVVKQLMEPFRRFSF